MGLFTSDADKRIRAQVEARRAEYLWRDEHQRLRNAERDERREAKADEREQRRSMERALSERNRQTEAKKREYAQQEKDARRDPIVKRTGGTRGVPLLTVEHHLSPDLPVLYLPPHTPGEPRVVRAAQAQVDAKPSLVRNEKFMAAAKLSHVHARETERDYGALLERLRDERWWHELTKAASLTLTKDGDPVPWKGRYAEGMQRVQIVNAPTISAIKVMGDGLRIRIAPRLGDTAKAWVAKTDLIRAAFKSAGVDAGALSIHETSRGGIELRFNDKDPFEHIDAVEQVYDPEKGRSLLGLDSNGKEVWITWSGNSGMVIGGVPGSGKTASMLGVFANMAGEAELYVFDGKAGFDLEPLSHIAAVYNAEGEYDSPLETLRELEALRVQRAQAIRSATGGNNFWNVPLDVRRKHGLAPIFVVLDEVQTWTDMSGSDKDEKAAKAEIIKLVRTLIQKARSVGIITILTTQKPDSVTIPTVIRDNAALKLSFKVSTPEQALTILGAQPNDAPSPVSISLAAKGRFVMETEGAGIVLGQSGYVSPAELNARLAGAPRVEDQRVVAARLLGAPLPTPRVRTAPVDFTAPAATVQESASPTPSTPTPTPSEGLPAHIAAIVPTPEEARAMTPEQRLEAMRLIAQLQGNLPTENTLTPEPAAETPEPEGRGDELDDKLTKLMAEPITPPPPPTITPPAGGIVEGEI